MKTFDERFRAIYPRIVALATRFASTTPIPSEEYESYLCEEFIKVDAGFNPKVNNSYKAYVGAMLETKAVRMSTRKERKFHDAIMTLEVPEDTDEVTKYPLELIADVDIEQEVFDVMFIEEQLAKADDETRSILEVFFADPYVSYRDISKITGISRPTLTRRLQSVALAVRDA